MPPPIKVFEVVDENEFLSITFYKKHADGMENGLISMLVISGLLVIGIILSFIFIPAPGSIALTILILILLAFLGLGIFLHLKSRKQVQKILITKDEITITKTYVRVDGIAVIPRKDFEFIQIDDPDKMDSGVESLLLLLSPGLLLLLGLTQRSSSILLFTNRGNIRFFEFGTNAQKAWVLKCITNFLNRTST